jgi:membrane-associated phospholipid phosphatase
MPNLRRTFFGFHARTAVSCFVVSILVGFQSPARAESVSSQQADEVAERSQGAWPYEPRRNFKEAWGELFNEKNRTTLAVGSVAILGSFALDDDAQTYFIKKRRFGGLEDLGNDYLGTGVPGALLGGAFWLIGDLSGNHYAVHAGQAQLETLFATGIVTAAVKGATGRARPDGSNNFAFPSGHTSTVFASASVLYEFYGWKAGLPAFAIATVTGLSRISDNRHWLSDTVGGAVLGLWMGHAFSKPHLDRYRSYDKSAGRDFSLHPVLEPGGGRLVFRMNF